MTTAPASRVVLATAGYDHQIKFWEASTGVCYRTIQYADSQINKLEITPDKQFIAAAGNPQVRFFDIQSNNPNPVSSYDGHKSNVTALGFQKDGRWMYTASEDNTIKIWDLRAPGCQRNYDCTGSVNTAVLHPNQAEILSGDQNGNIRVWDLTANACSRELIPDGENAVRSLSVTSDGSRVCAANNSGKCFIWGLGEKDTSSFDPLCKLDVCSTYILKTTFSYDGKWLAASCADNTTKLFSCAKDYALSKTLTGHTRWVWDCVFSAGSDYLVTASSDGSAKLWDISQGDPIRNYSGHSKSITCIALNDTA